MGPQAAGTPYNAFAPNGNQPVLTVVSVNNVPVSPTPLGNFTAPDVTFNAAAAVPVVIQGTNIPAGTAVSLQIYSETGADIIMANAGALAGAADPTSLTVPVTFPPGFSRGYISATFTPTPGTSAKTSAVANKK